MNKTPEQIIQDLLDPTKPIQEDELLKVAAEDPSVAVLIMIALAQKARTLPQPSHSTPSGQKPVYTKPPARKRRKKPGRKRGHPGVRRSQPVKIDRTVEHHLEQCPQCTHSMKEVKTHTRSRIIEDLPEMIQTETTEHLIHRGHCPNCKKMVEAPVSEAMPSASIGNRLLCLTAHWHYGLGLSISQIQDLLNTHLQFKLSAGGLVKMWRRLALHLSPWYEQLIRQVVASAVLHGDETGWRVNGMTYWLWCFTTATTTVYFLHPKRGHPALLEFFKETFAGTLITDFWSAYDIIAGPQRQFCLAHLLREFKNVSASNSSAEWCAFSKKARRIFQDALRLRAREDFTPEKYESRIQQINNRLIALMYDYEKAEDKDTRRLAKRIIRHWDELLVFLDDPDVPATNNHAEREIRPAVIMRKIIQGNRSDQGAWTQQVLMSIFRTAKSRGLNPVDTVKDSLTRSLQTGNLPELPSSLG